MQGTFVRFDDYEVDFNLRELRKHGVRVGLEHKPFRVLELLLRHPGELVSRDELIHFLWPDSNVSFERGLNTAVNSLRKALGESFQEPRFIETRSGMGYRFCAEVREFEDGHPKQGAGKSANANEDYLKGRYFLDRMSEDDTHKGISFFKSALVDDPLSALVQTGLADAYCQLALFRLTRSSDLERHARTATETALRSDPLLAQAHVSSGRVKFLFDWDWTGALQAVDRAVALDANSVPARILHALLMLILGRHERAVELSQQAVTLDPLSFPANVQLAACLYAVRDFKSAVDQCWKILTLTSQFAPAQILLALAYEQLGMYEEAIVEFRNAKRCAGFESVAEDGLRHLFAVSGHSGELSEEFPESPIRLENKAGSNYGCALLCAARGDTSQALAFLEQSLQQRNPAMLWVAADARFDTVRNDGRFDTVLTQAGILR